MVNAFYALIIILTALFSLIRGFRIGISQQIASLLGFSFGAVASRVLVNHFSTNFLWAAGLSESPEFNELIINLICCVTIYTVVFLLFSLLSPILQKTMAVMEPGIINRILGACLSLIKNLLWVSIGYNLLLCLWPSSGLLKYERSNDGNLIASVMDLTPSVLGCYGAQDFALLYQLKEAKYISCNFNTHKYVIFIKINEFTAIRTLNPFSGDISFVI